MLTPLSSRFEIARCLGEGGMGVVYEAYDSVRGETVALKTLRRSDANAIYRLKREFRALANAEHPNVVRLYDLFADEETSYFTMELIEGVDLAAYVVGGGIEGTEASEGPDPLRGQHRFDERALRHGVTGLLDGVGYLHSLGLLHRDLKPRNVLVTPRGRVVVLDFGLVTDTDITTRSNNNLFGGTVPYMAPEQALGDVELTTASDLYAVGVIVFQLLTGRYPFPGRSLGFLQAKLERAAPDPREWDESLPKDLTDLTVALLDRDPRARPSIDDARRILANVPHRRMTPPTRTPVRQILFGRDAELDTLAAQATNARSGTPAIALVRGRSGIGKSSLLTSFGRRAQLDWNAVVLAARCHERETVPYKGLDGVVDALSRHLNNVADDELGRLLPPNLGDLATVFPVLRRVAPVASAYARRSLAKRHEDRIRSQAFQCLRLVFRRIAEKRPLIVTIDDVQWADEDTAHALSELFRGDEAPAMFVLLGTRAEDESPVARELFGPRADEAKRMFARHLVDLDPISPAAMVELVRRDLGDEVHPSIVDAIVQESRGVPLAARELARLFEDDDETFDTTDSSRSIDALVVRRASTLEHGARRVLDVLAVAGEPMTADLALHTAGLGDEGYDAIDLLRLENWVKDVRAPAAVMIETTHDRVREALASAVDPETRIALQRHIATSLASLDVPPHDRLARHFAAAGDRASACEHALAAAEMSSRVLAFRRAAELFDFALANASDAQRATLHARHGEVLASAGRYLDAERAFVAASETGDDAERRTHLRRAAECVLYSGRIDEGMRMFDALAEDLGVRIPESPWALRWALFKARIAVAFRGLAFRPTPRDTVSRHALERVRSLAAIAVQVTPLDPIGGMVVTSRYLREALDLGVVEELPAALGLEGALRSGIERLGHPRHVVAILDRLGEDHGLARASVWASLVRGLVDLFSGRVAAAQTRIGDAVSTLEAAADSEPWMLSFAYYLWGYATLHCVGVGELERVARFVDRRESAAGLYAEFRLRTGFLPYYHMRLGETERVHAAASDAYWEGSMRRQVVVRTQTRLYSAWASLYEDDAAIALEKVLATRAIMKSNGSMRLMLPRSRCLTIQAACALRHGDPRRARESVRAYGRPRDDLQRAYAAWIRAIAEVAEGRPRDAVETLLAFRRSESIGSIPLIEAIACFALARLAEGTRAKDARARYLELVADGGIVDPDRFFWSLFPIGDPPPRARSLRSGWEPEVPVASLGSLDDRA